MTGGSGTGRYEGWMEEIRGELESFEGAGPPSADDLWSVAEHESRGAADWISDMPVSEDAIRTAKGDVLQALVSLEMAEERVEEADQDD